MGLKCKVLLGLSSALWAVNIWAQIWGPVVQISTAPNGRSLLSNARCITTDDYGRVYVVWAFWSPNVSDRGIYFRRSTDTGLTWDPERKLTGYTPLARMPAVDADGFGGVNIVWSDQRDSTDQIYFKRSTDSGATWGPDTRLTFYRYSGKGYPTLVTDQRNWVQLVWIDNRLGPSEEIFYKRSTDGGSTWTSDTALTLPPHYVISLSIGADEYEGVHLVWDGRPGGSSDSSRVFYRRSTDSGVTWDTVRQLNTSLFQAHYPSVSADSQGFVYCAWADKRSGGSQIYFRRSTDSGSTWDSEITLAATPGYLFGGPSVTTGPGGNVGVGYSWLAYSPLRNGIAYRHSTDRGMTWSPEERVSDTINHWGGSFSTAMDHFGRVHVAWSDSTDSLRYWAVYYRRRDAGVGVETNPPSSLPPYASRLTVSPNPFTSFATLPGHEAEHFSLYDISGRRVGTYRGDRVGEGLAPGVYFVCEGTACRAPTRIVKVR